MSIVTASCVIEYPPDILVRPEADGDHEQPSDAGTKPRRQIL